MSRRSAGKRSRRPTQSTPSMPPPAGVRWRAVVIAVAGMLAYANSLRGAFILDDQGTIVDNHQIRALSRLTDVLFPDVGSSVSGRPLVSLSFAINYAIGGLNVVGYHVWNVAVHLACALLLFGVVRRTLDLPRVRDRVGAGVNAAFAVALIWVLHPLNTETVDYLTQRSESMVALCFLLALYAVLRAATTPAPRWRAVAIAASAAGMACKESMAVAPLLVLLFDRTFLAGSWSEALRARRSIYAGLGATWLLLIALNHSGPRSEVVGFSTGVSSWTYLLNQAEMIGTYMRLAFWPHPLVVFYGWPLPLTLADVWLPGLFLAAFGVASLIGVFRTSMLAFLGAWFFVTLAPTSSIVPIATEVGAERRMYLPLMAVVVLVVVGVSALSKQASGRWPSSAGPAASLAEAIAIVLVCGALVFGTFTRNGEYASALTMAQTVVDRRPTGVAHHILAEQLVQANRHDEAIAHLREAVALGDSRAGYTLGIQLYNAGRFNEAIDEFDRFFHTWRLPYRLVPHWLEPAGEEAMASLLNMSRAYALQRRWPQSAEQARRALAIAPARSDARLLLADALFNQQQFEEAGQLYREYLTVQRDDAHALTNFGVTMVAGERLPEAIAAFSRVVQLEPKNANARRILSMALLDHGDVEQALDAAKAALALKPDDPALRDVLNRAAAAQAGRTRSPHD
jgi:tetratricopeptide (TPR) repeat protein